MISEDAIRSFQETVAAPFEAGMEVFPHYTLHGRAHLEELDRLALLICGFIPELQQDEQRRNLLRLAIIMHDYGMVKVPSKRSEEELRKKMSPLDSFADAIRKVHQDEIEGLFADPACSSALANLLPNVEPYLLDDACTIARYHRFHPVKNAREDIRELCALMRIIDELDVGPRRAPIPAYDAKRERMDRTSRFHWLKHICARPINRYSTFSVEIRDRLRVLRVWIAVKATTDSWAPIQDMIIRKVRRCLEKEGSNAVLRERLQLEFQVEAAPESMCGVLPSLPSLVKADLNELVKVGFFRADEGEATKVRESAAARTPGRTKEGGAEEATGAASSRKPEMRIVAIPPERLAEVLCNSGRLTVIGNKYVQPELQHVGGTEGAPSRIYVGPADCGKTRAALEWIEGLTAGSESQWVVLRTQMGTIPEGIQDIVVDTSEYEKRHQGMPGKAVLFLDDLPLNLPDPESKFTAEDAVRGLLDWFAKLPYFRERRVAGTMRNEDVHARPGWPDILPSLGKGLELLRPEALDADKYRELWEGMGAGMVSQSLTKGVSEYRIAVKKAFVKKVSESKADPEAVATFVRQAAIRKENSFKAGDAERFRGSAVETWLTETWPAIGEAYGVAAKVFFWLARFLEAGGRPETGFRTSLMPAWEYHEAFGQELCEQYGAGGLEYLKLIDRMGRDGHAAGTGGAWIRPRFDFILQAESLGEAEVEPPSYQWLAERSLRLSGEGRQFLATHLTAAGVQLAVPAEANARWFFGCAHGTLLLRENERDGARMAELLENEIGLLRQAVEADCKLASAWNNLGAALGEEADAQRDPEKAARLRDEGLQAYRRAVEVDPKHASALTNLGAAIGRKADREKNRSKASSLWEEAVQAHRRAVEADPNHGTALTNLGAALGKKAGQEEDPGKAAGLREEELQAHRRAVQSDPNHATALSNLGVALGKRADQEKNQARAGALRDEQMQAFQRAVKADPRHADALSNLGMALEKRADREQDGGKAASLRREAVRAHRRAVEADPRHADALSNLALALEKTANREKDPGPAAPLRQEAVETLRRAVRADPDHAVAWYNLSGSCLRLWRLTHEDRLLSEAVTAGRKAAELGRGHYNLACALALSGQIDEGLGQLAVSLKAGEISVEHVKEDHDWDHLRDHPGFRQILEEAVD